MPIKTEQFQCHIFLIAFALHGMLPYANGKTEKSPISREAMRGD